jgi:hypothetical protein
MRNRAPRKSRRVTACRENRAAQFAPRNRAYMLRQF